MKEKRKETKKSDFMVLMAIQAVYTNLCPFIWIQQHFEIKAHLQIITFFPLEAVIPTLLRNSSIIWT